MIPLLDYLWPSLIIGALVGVVAGLILWRRSLVGMQRNLAFGTAGLAAIAGFLLWSGPFGAADRFINAVETPIRQMLVHYEMSQVRAELRHAPLRRQIFYRGPADEVQRTELVRMAEESPGIASATWSPKVRAIPIVVEGAAVALLGLLLGLLIAYLLDVRRRNNAEWRW
ncbi:MAG: hypothetical protein ABIO29_08795 [Sphingomicrobium sp.]